MIRNVQLRVVDTSVVVALFRFDAETIERLATRDAHFDRIPDLVVERW